MNKINSKVIEPIQAQGIRLKLANKAMQKSFDLSRPKNELQKELLTVISLLDEEDRESFHEALFIVLGCEQTTRH